MRVKRTFGILLNQKMAGLYDGATEAAETVDLPQISQRSSETESSCGICLEVYKEPKLLPCCHTFCKLCLDKLAAVSPPAALNPQQRQEKLKCPECRAEHDIPKGGIADFLTDFSVEARFSPVRRAGDTAQQAKPTCSECEESGALAIAYCYDCEAFICESCKDALHKPRRYQSHSIKLLSDSFDPLPSKLESGTNMSIMCPIHPSERQSAYCKQCMCLVCIHCVINSHQKHNIADVATIQKDVEEMLEAPMQHGISQIKDFEQHLKHLKSIEALVCGRIEKLESAINKAIDSEISKLEKRRKALFEEAQGQMKKIWSQKDEVEMVVLGLKSALKLSRRVKTCSRDPEAIGLASQACSKLNELRQQKWSAPASLWQSGLQFSHQSISIHLNKFGYLKAVSMVPRLSINIPSEIELGKPVSFKIIEKEPHALEIWLTYTPSNVWPWAAAVHTPLEVSVTYGLKRKGRKLLIEDGTSEVVFRPVCGGKHTITASPNSAFELKNISFTVTGMPPIGSKVVRGPDFGSGSKFQPQTVTEHCIPPYRDSEDDNEWSLIVESDCGEYYASWGDNNGQYSVELAEEL